MTGVCVSVFSEMIEVVCNDRLGKKVRVKCKYPLKHRVGVQKSLFDCVCVVCECVWVVVGGR